MGSKLRPRHQEPLKNECEKFFHFYVNFFHFYVKFYNYANFNI